MKGQAKTKLRNFGKELKTYWNKPAPGKFVPYKEYLEICGAINFNYALKTPVSYISFAANCYLIMYHYHVPYLTFSIITLIGLPLGYLWKFLSWIVGDNLGFMDKKTTRTIFTIYAVAIALGIGLIASDLSGLFALNETLAAKINSLSGINTTTFLKIFGVQLLADSGAGLWDMFWSKKLIPKYGRYKYRIYSDWAPKALLFILIGWLPIEAIGDDAQRIWVAYLMIRLFTMFNSDDRMTSCAAQISPNPQERILVRTWPVKLGHLFNSILAFILPIVIAWFPGGFADIGIYRYVMPASFILCGALTYILAPKVHERIPQPPLDKKVKINFWDGVFGVMRNKYQWINTIVNTFDSLGNGMLDITVVILLYTMRVDGIVYSILVTLISAAGTIPSFIAPYFIKRFSYKSIRIFGQLASAIVSGLYIVALYFCGTHYIALGVFLVLLRMVYNFTREVPIVAQKDMDERLFDYQMYLSGERLQNFSGLFSIINSPITTFVGLLIPMILLKNGFNNNWDILFVDSARFKIIAVPIALDAVGFLLMAIPFFFWDYDNKKHETVIKELNRRAEILGGQVYEDKEKDAA